MTTQNLCNFIQELTSIAPRRGINENKAADIIKNYLYKENIQFKIQEFTTVIPEFIKAELFADGESIPCIGSSFMSGKFDNNSKILNAFGAKSEGSMIVFNPASLGVCLQSYKDSPSLSINRDSVVKLIMATEIKGEVNVQEKEFTSQNILVGNLINPTKIVFAHYDSIIGSGAIDNASSVDVLYQTIISNKSLLDKNLFVFVGSEEESFSSHIGCYGFDVFDKEYSNIMNSALELLVLDGVGVSTPAFVNNHIDWVFTVSRVDEIKSKIFWMQNDQSLVMKYYHSELDTLDKLNQEYINQAKDLLELRFAQDLGVKTV